MSERPDPLAPPPGYGQRRSELPAQQVPAAQCCMQYGTCPRPAAATAWLGDKQEHVYPLRVCAADLPLMRALPRWCTTCRERGAADDSLRVLKVEADPGSADISQAALDRIFGNS